MQLSAIILYRIFIIVLYSLTGFIAYRWLLPRMSPLARRTAIALFVAQVLMMSVASGVETHHGLKNSPWGLNGERNIPATLSSIQLLLTGVIALMTATAGDGFTRSRRLFLLGIAWLFLVFAFDEYFRLHEGRPVVWRLYHMAGVTVTLFTLAIAWRSPNRLRLWYLMIPAGLAVSAFGAYVLETYNFRCVQLPAIHGCVEAMTYEETLEFLGVWLALAGVLGIFSAAIPQPKRFIHIFMRSIPPLILIPLLALMTSNLSILQTQFVSRFFYEPVEVQYDSKVSMFGYQIESDATSLTVQLLVSSTNWHHFTELGYSVHLVDQATGKSLAGADAANRRKSWRLAVYERLIRYRQTLIVDKTRIPANRAFWVALTQWRGSGEEITRQSVRLSDLPLLDDVTVVLDELVMPADPPAAPSSAPLAIFDNGFALAAVDMPERAGAGETLEIAFAWRADKQGEEDFVQFLHLGHADSGQWFVYDQQPLGDRLPTRLWYAGLSDSETWQAPLPADLAPGRYDVFTGLYRASDLERVTATDAEGVPWPDNRVALGGLIIE